MIKIGQYNHLKVVHTTDFGLYLDGGDQGDILLPQRYVPEGTEIGQELRVFIYNDSEDRLIATTLEPAAIVGQFAFLPVVSVTRYGAFLDWGLPKDLLVPYREQATPMQAGKSYLVRLYLDEKSQRIVATSRLNRFLRATSQAHQEGQEVRLWIARATELGYQVIVDEAYWGVLYRNEVFQRLRTGQQLTGYIKQVREDGKLDISLQASGYRQVVPDAADKLLQQLRDNHGFLALTDKSKPEHIYAALQMSKKTFKKALGQLYKQQLVDLEPDGVRLKPE